jgi:branched-chain amino acid transport system substrate-binding protein
MRTSYDTKKGLECYDAAKPKNPVIVNPMSTGITLSLIPKASVDKIPILSLGYGLSASAKGDVFPWIFNPPATYWDGASEILKYIGGGSIEALKGKTIGYLYFDGGFGREPIPLFQALAKQIGFDLKHRWRRRRAEPGQLARHPPRQARFLVIRLGRHEPDRNQGAAKAEFPMDKFVRSGGQRQRRRCGWQGGKGFTEVMPRGRLSCLRRHQDESHRRRQEPDAGRRVRPSSL